MGPKGSLGSAHTLIYLYYRFKTHIYSSLWMQPSLTRSQSSRASFDRASLARRLTDGCIHRLYVHCRSCMALVLLKLRFLVRSAKRFLRTCAHGCDYRQEK